MYRRNGVVCRQLKPGSHRRWCRKWGWRRGRVPATWADPADRFWGKFWLRGPNLSPFSTFSTDLGHFILKMLNFDIIFILFIFYIYLSFGVKTHSQSVWGAMAPCPLDPPMPRSEKVRRERPLPSRFENEVAQIRCLFRFLGYFRE